MLDLVSEAPPRGHNPVLLLAAVHYLLLGGLDHELAAVYAGESDADPGPLFVDLCLRNRDTLVDLLATEQVNTNEVGRSAVIGPALTDRGRSAGGTARLTSTSGAAPGSTCSATAIASTTARPARPGRRMLPWRSDVTSSPGRRRSHRRCRRSRRGIGLDRAPLDVHDPEQSRWQLACVWPDTGRLDADQAGARGGSSHAARAGAGRRRRGRRRSDRRPSARCHRRGDDDLGRGLLLPRAADRVPRRAGRRRGRLGPWRGSARENQGVVDLIPSDAAPSDANGVEWSVLGLVTFRDGHVHPELLGYVHPHGSGIDWRAGSASARP